MSIKLYRCNTQTHAVMQKIIELPASRVASTFFRVADEICQMLVSFYKPGYTILKSYD